MPRVEAAARRLAEAWRSGARIPDLGAARPRSRDQAYAVQDAVTEILDLPVAGWKVGAATPAIMRQRGLDEPIPGPLFGPRVYAGDATLPAADGRRGIALPAGSVILTGSLTEPHPVAPGSNAVARFDGGAEVRMSIAGTHWRGVLIAEALDDTAGIWDLVTVTGRSKQRLERERSRGEFTFCNVEVAEEDVDSLLCTVAARLRAPGWYFHLERDRAIKVAYPRRVMEMSASDPGSIHAARTYGVSIGIHPEQLHFERFIGNPFDQ